MISSCGSGIGSSRAGCGRLCDAWDRGQKAGDGIAAIGRSSGFAKCMLRQLKPRSAMCTRAGWSGRCRKNRRRCSGWSRRVFPESLRHALQAGLLLDAQDIAPDHAVQPMLREWVMGLWTERLVGGEASRRDDSPALVAVCGLSNRAGYRLCRVAGLGKMIVAGVKPSEKAADRILVRSRVEWLEGRLGRSDPEFRAAALADVQSMARSKLPRRRHAARIGLLTLARLLADFEPFRLRWALQHWPYPIVKLIRSLMSSPAKPNAGDACRRDGALENRLGTAHAGGTAGRSSGPRRRRS